MNGVSIAFLLINVVAILAVPRRWVCLPLLTGVCYMTYGQALNLGPLTFTVLRLLILAGVIRVLVRGEGLTERLNGLDFLILAFGGVAVLSSLGHNDPVAALVFRMGLFFDTAGVYLLLRIFCRSAEDVYRLCGIIGIVLVPVALEMVHEKMTGRNLFSIFGGVPEVCPVRQGRIRAQGPFGHSILAGTVGALCLPLLVGLWNRNRRVAAMGLVAAITMVLASASSGPVMSLMTALVALFMWRYREITRFLRWAGVMGYLALDFVMKDPAYFLLARIDIAGGSTGWHRARLIQSAFGHIDEWWVTGTDYTRHWMPTGVSWSGSHTDITNHYLLLGVHGGIPLMILFIACLFKGFALVGESLGQDRELPAAYEFLSWTLGASLFAAAVTGVSVAYFDQSFVFVYIVLGAIASTRNWSPSDTISQQSGSDSADDAACSDLVDGAPACPSGNR